MTTVWVLILIAFSLGLAIGFRAGIEQIKVELYGSQLTHEEGEDYGKRSKEE
jgi:hypothetical protein